MKANQTVRNLVDRAMEKGDAVLTKNGVRVYEVYKNGDILTVKHYGTVILVYDMHMKEIESWGGYSTSDRDALNNILFMVDHRTTEYFRIKGKKRDTILYLVDEDQEEGEC